ncbi:MAG: 1-deoxy-D-xylulose-5-phosphate synthase [Thermodesulfobacteriota bacterium]|nr:1-deoxy-D-xylulose-5-phosphate synthase [Thermodesulfobacteriota bacterium]
MAPNKENSLSILPRIQAPRHVHGLTLPELETLAGEIRQVIIDTVSRTGGHLAPSLGVVELTLALLKVFDPEADKIIWDVGHQAYGYKLLTSRYARFHTLRTLGGVSGFPKRGESPYDHFGVGHSSTSISAGLGMAVARDLSGADHKVVAVIGDGSMTAGLSFEGLNQAGHLGRDLIVVLNDNEMSISRNVGAMSSFLSRSLSKRWVVRFKKEMEAWLKQVPRIGKDLANYARKSEESLKSFFTPGNLFEAFQFNYLGPFDGHNLNSLINIFEQVKGLQGPVLVHVMTIKGKGYAPAESNPTYFHGVGSFEPETGQAKKLSPNKLPSYTEVFGDTLCSLAEKDDKIFAITAAMPEGTGLAKFAEKFPNRFVDVGICEQHAVTFAAGLATQGFKPVVAIYSTFMQRSFDQVVHDVCLQNLDVTFCLDRGGLVGEDGPTHHGAFDLSYMRQIPNMALMAPKDEAELQSMLLTAVTHPGPVAVRYPRGVGVGSDLPDEPEPVPLGRGEMLHQGKDAAIIVVGSRVHPSLEAAKEIEAEKDLSVAVFNARFIKPLPEEQLLEIARDFDALLLVEENALAGGFGSAVLEFLSDSGALSGKRIKRLGLPDSFVEHGKQKELRAQIGIDQSGIKSALLELLGALRGR